MTLPYPINKEFNSLEEAQEKIEFIVYKTVTRVHFLARTKIIPNNFIDGRRRVIYRNEMIYEEDQYYGFSFFVPLTVMGRINHSHDNSYILSKLDNDVEYRNELERVLKILPDRETEIESNVSIEDQDYPKIIYKNNVENNA